MKGALGIKGKEADLEGNRLLVGRCFSNKSGFNFGKLIIFLNKASVQATVDVLYFRQRMHLWKIFSLSNMVGFWNVSGFTESFLG